jgi:hypothetical protein
MLVAAPFLLILDLLVILVAVGGIIALSKTVLVILVIIAIAIAIAGPVVTYTRR